jgi:hypothetical protein
MFNRKFLSAYDKSKSNGLQKKMHSHFLPLAVAASVVFTREQTSRSGCDDLNQIFAVGIGLFRKIKICRS